MEIINFIIEWTNQNSGFVSFLLFIITLLLAWISGFFKLLVNKPKFKIDLIEQCSFCCVFNFDEKHKGFPTHKTAFVLYVKITNIGNVPSSIGDIKLGYFKNDFLCNFLSKRNWLFETIIKEDFKISFTNSESIKIFPFLKQKNQLLDNGIDLYLSVGRQNNGIIYFEQEEAYGSWLPRKNKDGKTTDVKIEIEDMFGKKHSKKIKIKFIEPEEALKYNSYFGQTYKEYFKIN